MNHISFPSIEGFHNIVKTYEVYPHIFSATQVYRGKPKLHGTNAGVRLELGSITAQSRERDIKVGDDNHGFAGWVERNHDFFHQIRVNIGFDIVMFGEWAGPGIMKGTACNQIEEKFFGIFLVMLNLEHDDPSVLTDPDDIRKLLGDDIPADVHILPWIGEDISITWADRNSLVEATEKANAAVADFEIADPWMKETFGVEGIGEGLVYYPIDIVSRKRFGDFAFKAKGTKHKTQKTKMAVQIDPEVVASIDEFVSMFVTEARLEQGLEHVGGVADPKVTGPFIGWVSKDVEKESADELEASGLDWKQVAKPIGSRARDWFLERSKVI